jgi:hypothetical protein
MSPESCNGWRIARYLDNTLAGDELRWVNEPLPELAEGQLLLETCLLSLDASNLLWLSEKRDYLPQLQVGEWMRGNVIAKVVASRHPDFALGDYVMSLQSWADYKVVSGDELLNDGFTLRFSPHTDIPLDAYMGTLGLTAWSAYIGLMTVGRLQAGQRVLISGAAGATGLMAAQLAKAAGAQVFGIAGGSRKCEFLTEQLGLDGAVDYRASRDLTADIREMIPDGVELFFDNVGGEILDAVLPTMTIGGCIVASGSVSQYGKHDSYGVKNLPLVTLHRLRMEGFLILDHMAEVPAILQQLEQWFLAGKLVNQNQLFHGLENAPKALAMLAEGGNTGKLAVYVGKYSHTS